VFAGPAAFGGIAGVPIGLAFDSAGNLFVTGATATSTTVDTIFEFTPGGTESVFATGLNNARGLAFDPSGNLFVAESITVGGDILEFTPGGVQSVFASGLSLPEWLTFGPARRPAGPNVPDSGSTFILLFAALGGLICFHRRMAVVRN